MRLARRQLGPLAHLQASNAVVAHALSSDWFISGMHVAAYWAARSELSLKPLLGLLLARGVFVYLPFIEADGVMHFARYHGVSLVPGRYGILSSALRKPDHHNASVSAVPSFDLILLPLLAFDAQGRRLGQGGGYYDRYLQNLDMAISMRVGIAFDFQGVDSVPTEQFDEKLHAVITECGVCRFLDSSKRALP